MTDHSTHTKAHGGSEKVLLGITHDPILRPAGILMVIVGMIWALFSGMADAAGTYGQPLAAVGLVVLGILIAGAGKPGEQI